MENDDVVRGSCLCGGVAWQARGPFRAMSHCHCSMCRKSHGAAFGTYLAAAADGCLCGDVAYELQAGGFTLMQCHCSRCRRARSAAHGTNLFVPADRFRWLRGQSALGAYKLPEAERFTQAFCKRCGSTMPRDAGAFAVVPAGSLDGDPGIADRKHIFTGSKAPWFEIADRSPQYEAAPPRG